jgi:quercetin 2,3-dioxygenase
MGDARGVSRVVPAIRTLEGAGFEVRRPFPTQALMDADPFLLLDEMGPADLPPGEARGAPDHPHRGFETVTYVLSGEMEHRDSAGHHGSIRAGDVQWMTAGDGVVHSEMPSEAFQRTGGRMHGFQLWVNLPRRDKRMAPRYQEVPAARIPVARSGDGKVEVRVIAGEALGKRAVIDTRTPIAYLHFTIAPGGAIVQPTQRDYSGFCYVFGGEGRIGSAATKVQEGEIALLGPGDEVAIAQAGERPLEVLLVAGVPLGEPVARYGPFVMNTEGEIRQAIEDFRQGRMGRIR